MEMAGLSSRDIFLLSVLASCRVFSLTDVAVLLGLNREEMGKGLVDKGVGKPIEQVEKLLGEIRGGIVPVQERVLPVPSNVNRVVKRWEEKGLVRREHLLQSVGPVVVPTAAAAELAGVPASRPPGVGVLEHALAINRVRWTVETVTDLEWVSESSLARDAEGKKHVPDGALKKAGADAPSVVVEVERAAKGPKRLAPLLVDLLRTHDRVLYVCASRSVAEGVGRALAGAVKRPDDQKRLLVCVEGERLPEPFLAQFGRSGVRPTASPVPSPRPEPKPPVPQGNWQGYGGGGAAATPQARHTI
jgi:hypothetical protein